MNECYVSFEQAKILKELGFDGWEYDDCEYWYYHNYDDPEKTILDRREAVDNYEVKEYWFAPTCAFARSWIFEKYGLWIELHLVPAMESSPCKFVWSINDKTTGHICNGLKDIKWLCDEKICWICGINKALDIIQERIYELE